MDEGFKKAVDFIQALPSDGPYQPSIQEKLQFYALFKQATCGQNKVKKPAFYDVVAKTKWEAWKKLGKMSKHDAMKKYIANFIKVASKIPDDDAKKLVLELRQQGLAAKL